MGQRRLAKFDLSMINANSEEKRGRAYYAVKRSADIVFSAILLAVLFPILIIVALVIALTSKGGVFFRQERVGRNGNLFKIIKFRTMVDGAERMGPLVTSADDRRITRVGQILRATKLDELPQFWNVLVGDMSIVGPRPQVPRYVDLFDPAQRAEILSLRPGITGPTAIMFRHEESILETREDRESFYVDYLLPVKCQIDVTYVNSCSLKTDVNAFFATFTLLFRGVFHRLLGRPIGKKLELSNIHRLLIEQYPGEPVELTGEPKPVPAKPAPAKAVVAEKPLVVEDKGKPVLQR